MLKELTKEKIEARLQSNSLDELSVEELFELFRTEPALADFAPDGRFAVDPRDGGVVLYSAARAGRPHDNKQEEHAAKTMKPCPICEGRTTGIVDVAELSSGYTFINKNLFPCVFAKESELGAAAMSDSNRAFGIHLLQWTSTHHDLDWHNMPVEDLTVVLDRLAALEKKLLFESGSVMSGMAERRGAPGAFGFVSIIKNLGAPVGGSLTHGHQQIVFSNVMPAAVRDNLRFQETHHMTFSEHLLGAADESLVIERHDEAVVLVPYFMKRPYRSMIVMTDFEKQYLHQLSKKERVALARGWSALAKAFKELMGRMGKEFAYNALVHNGPGAGLYVEFLPYTQEDGGYERLGLWVCQESPVGSAKALRDAIREE